MHRLALLCLVTCAALGCDRAAPRDCPEPRCPELEAGAAEEPAASAPAREGPPVIGMSGYVVATAEDGGEGLGRYRVTRTYREALARAGAIPLHLLPVPAEEVAALLDRVDALLLCGGPDIDPAAYDEERHPSVQLLPEERQSFDFALAREALRREMPILGICLGSQELNVVRGGSLIQDIPSEVDGALSHRQLEVSQLRSGVHDVQIVEGTRLARLYGGQRTIRVNSAHHQASDDLGEGLVVSARASDGVVEAWEDPDYPFLVGVQFHPEIQTAPAGQHDRLFRDFVEAAARYRAQGGAGEATGTGAQP